MSILSAQQAHLLSAIQFHPLIEWRYTPTKGRGVFAKQDLAPDLLIECSPVVIFPASDLLSDPHKALKLHQHIFWWSDIRGQEHALGWGYLALYNHSDEPNIELSEGPLPDTMQVKTLSMVTAGQELVFDYGETWFQKA